MKTKRFKKAIIIFSITSSIILSSACSTSRVSTENEKDSKNEVTIAFRSGGSTNSGLIQWMKQEVIPEFEKKYPNTKVKLSPLNVSEGNYFAKVALMLKSKNTNLDVVTEDTFMVNADARAGYLEPLDKKVSKWEDWKYFVESVKTGVKDQNGGIYGIPYNTDTRGLWYNKEIFREVGLPVPWKPKTWNDIIAAAKKIKEKSSPDIVPIWMNSGKATGEATSMQTFEMLLNGTNTPLYDVKTKKWIVKSQGLTNTFKFIDEIYERKLGPSLSLVLNGQGSAIAYQQLMPKGKLAIGLDGIWQTGNWRKDGPAPWPEAEEKLGFAQMPTEKGQSPGNVTMAGGWALSIAKNSDNKAMAWELIKVASSKENNLKLLSLEKSLSPRKDVAKDPEYLDNPKFKEATEMLKNAQFRPSEDKYPNVSTQIQTLVESVVTDRLTPNEAAKRYEEYVTNIVGEQNVIKK
ncbi:extracellular solute-binding protein [Priestia megaterium]|uniref:extracellular solute-binding protein n=1 Tax=Priestia megaterium TaxID=1404 RepID=UPI000419984A|nr:extracellular solute-binding protein [Priestia megaterium]PFT51471.1 ABC transporter substrate-binding protein [Priestia megaterium]